MKLPWRGLAMLVLAYIAVATVAYRFRFPEKTETELFLEIPRALVWDWTSSP